MSRMLLSKKSKMPAVLVGMCVVLLLVGILLFATQDSPFAMLGNGADAARFFSIAAPVLCLIAAIFVGASLFRYNKAYIQIYDDHIEGNGLLSKGGMRAQSFRLAKGQYNITLEGKTYLCVRADGANYYLHFSEADMQQILDCINGNVHEPQPRQAPAQIFACPACSTQCRVPGGRGNIVIKCPKCGEKFNART